MHPAEDSSSLRAVPGDASNRLALEVEGDWPWEANLVDDTTIYAAGFWENFGYDPAQMTETFDFLNVMRKRDIPAVTRAWRAHLDGETDSYQSEWRLRTATGEWRWIRSRGRITERDATGKPTRMAGAYTDITSMKLAPP